MYTMWKCNDTGRLLKPLLIFLLVSFVFLISYPNWSRIETRTTTSLPGSVNTDVPKHRIEFDINDLASLLLNAMELSEYEYINRSFHFHNQVHYTMQIPNVQNDIVSHHLASKGAWEFDALKMIDCLMRLCADTYPLQQCQFLDVGANIGSFSVPIAAGGFKVHAIEANKHNVKTLLHSRNTNINKNVTDNLIIYPFAAGDRNDILRMDASNDNIFDAKILEANATSMATYIPRGSTFVVRLDDILSDKNIYGIKLDIEGFEYTALQGMKKITASPHIKFIFAEVYPQAINDRSYVQTKKYGEYLFNLGFGCRQVTTLYANYNCNTYVGEFDKDKHMALFDLPQIDLICIRR